MAGNRILSLIDPMVRLLAIAILLASFIPVRGPGREIAQLVANAAVFLLFFLNGLRLSRADVLRGIGNLRFLSPLVAWVFLAMTAAGWAVYQVGLLFLPPVVALGFLYVGALPSTVQSATAYSSLAGGNVASSVVAAALLNILGVIVTAPLFSLLAGNAHVAMGWEGLFKVVLILLLPFMLGQFTQRWARGWVLENRTIVTWMDRMSIAIAVYVAFSGAVEQGIWQRVASADWLFILLGIATMLVIAFGGAWMLSGAIGLQRDDRISFLFAGAHKSIAMGAPLAMVLFPPAVAGLMLLPALIYHLVQLIASAPLAARLARH